MLIYPAIDLYEGKAVRLFQGDYAQMTVYREDPLEAALDFKNQGAAQMHVVDLEGAKKGTTSNISVIRRLKKESGLFVEVGGGIRTMETAAAYLEAGVDRIILGTAAVKDPVFLKALLAAYGERIAVGIDLKDGFVAIRGWTQTTALEAAAFTRQMAELGVKTVICTDIRKDGAMQGPNTQLYRKLREIPGMRLIASGGVSGMEDIRSLRKLELYGAIIGKAYYEGKISISEAVREAE